MLSIKKLKAIQNKIASEVRLEEFTLREGARIVGFDCAVIGEDLICAATVMEYPSMRLLEKKTLRKRAPMQYLPTFFAFREGPLILELYYNLETDPTLIMIDDAGIAHPDKCGLASYVGVELHKPTIGVAKSLVWGALQGDEVHINGEKVGMQIKTREYAKPLFISPGNLITIEAAAEIALKLVIPPHKLPEPLHAAHRVASIERKKSTGAGAEPSEQHEESF